jgi:hypothetical protein
MFPHCFNEIPLGADAHRDNGKRFVVHADEKLTAFLELGNKVVTKDFLLRI